MTQGETQRQLRGRAPLAWFLLTVMMVLLAIALLAPTGAPAANAAGKPTKVPTSTPSGSTPTPTPISSGPRDLLLPPGSNTVWHGLFLETRNLTATSITNFEAEANRKVGVEMMYVGWYIGAWDNVQKQINVWEPLGIKTHVVWEPTLKNGSDPLAAILSGSENAIIDDMANKARIYGKPFFLRFAHEMNGNWYSWSGATTGQNPQKYIDAWRYVYNRFQAAGATNAVWVWSPNADSVPNEPWNNLTNYYPGDAYVDWVGVDGYGLMWGNEDPGAIMDAVYLTYGSKKPIMVSETAAADCTDYAAGTTMTKDQWINLFFTDLAERPNIRAFFWFNVNKESDWRITSCPSPATLNAYRNGVSSSRIITR